jgi:hypothetical protein
MRRCFVILIGLVFAVPTFGQDAVRAATALSVTAFPHVTIPFANDPVYFTTGGGADVSVEVPLPFFPSLMLRMVAGYQLLPIWSGDVTNFAQFTGGVAVAGPTLAGKVTTEIKAGGGYYYGVVSGTSGSSGGNAKFDGGLRIGWRISPRFDVGLDVQYAAALDGIGGLLYNSLNVGLSTRYGFLRRSQLQIRDIEIDNVFPVLYKRYTNRPFGIITVANDSPTKIENLRVSFFVKDYMDKPWQCNAPESLAGGEETNVGLVALFNEREILGITEVTVVTGQITVSYSQDGKDQGVERNVSIRILDRHAMTWDDDRKAAAYVTHKDPVVIDLASELARVAEVRGDFMDKSFRIALALHEAFRKYGLEYRIDPKTPFIEFSEDMHAIDYVQFPRNTLQRRTGDCDDLSILYSAMLQSVGIDTAFITIPGHIYIAFALNVSPEEALVLFSAPQDIIIHKNRAWIPIEITLVDAPFLEAWATGAAQWRVNNETGAAAIIPISEAWIEYEPVAQVGDFDAEEFVSAEESTEGFIQEFERFVDREISNQTGPLMDKISLGNAKPHILNRLGGIYARYGRKEDARMYFERALADSDYYPALVNLAHLEFLEGKLRQALLLYTKALDYRPGNPVLLLQIARVHHELGDYSALKTAYDALREADATLADRHSYLDMSLPWAQRALSRDVAGSSIIWIDEQ